MPQPLPPTLPKSLVTSSQIPLAYARILLLERVFSSSANRNACEKKFIHSRILGYLILEGPSTRAREHVAQEVNACQDNDQMDTLGEMYFSNYICIFKKSKGRTPAPSSHSSRSGFETKEDMIKEMLREGPHHHHDAEKIALVRDNFRCIVTGKYDTKSVEENRELEREVSESHDPRDLSPTVCSLIFPQLTNANTSGSNQGSAKHDYAASVWTILQYFGYEGLPERLNGAGVHSLDNVMTLDPLIHSYFDDLKLWFEAVDDRENTYTIHAMRSLHLRSCKANPVTFQSIRPDLPLPNPVYLKIHASCCRVAHLSGAAEYMDKILQDLEGIRVLSEDGSSAHVLSFALQSHIRPNL